jgi:hypothetical protein
VGRDEETRDDEEDVDADVPAGHAVGVQVEGDDQEDGDGAQPLHLGAEARVGRRPARGGRDNDPDFFSRMRGQGPWADLIRRRVELASARAGLSRERWVLRTDLFRPPVPPGTQMRLL